MPQKRLKRIKGMKYLAPSPPSDAERKVQRLCC